MALRPLFVTQIYEASLAGERDFAAFNEELEDACRMLADEDMAGRAWCKEHRYGGYTSYASLDDLPMRASIFDDLKRKLDRHAAAYAMTTEALAGIKVSEEAERARGIGLELERLANHVGDPGVIAPGTRKPPAPLPRLRRLCVPLRPARRPCPLWRRARSTGVRAALSRARRPARAGAGRPGPRAVPA